MAIDNNDFTHEFQIYSTDLNAGTIGTGKFLLFDNNINAVKVESIDNIKIGGGSNGRVLATDGEGNLRWISAAAVTGGISSYDELDNVPDLSVYAQTSSLAAVATSGSYNDLTNKPTIPDLTGYATESWVTSQGFGSGTSDHEAYEITNTSLEGSIYSVSVGTNGVVTMTTARGGIEFGAMPEVGGPSHFHIMRPAGQNSSTDLYFGDDYNYVKMPGLYGSNPTTQQGVEIGSSLDQGTVSVWKFGTDGDLVLPAGKTIRDTSGIDLLADVDTLLEPYKGFRAHYGTMYNGTDEEQGPINKLVIYKSTVSPSSVIDTSTESDDFQVTGLTGSDVVAMLVVVSDGTDFEIQTPTATLKTFVEKIIDEVILDEGVEGDVNTVSAMRTAFYANFSNFNTVIPNVKTDLAFFNTSNLVYNVTDYTQVVNSGTGSGWQWYGVKYNPTTSQFEMNSGSTGAPGGFAIGDTLTILGTNLTDYLGNTLVTPDNNIVITVATIDGSGIPQTFTTTGTVPYTTPAWPSASIDDGGDDEYDGGNAIHTNLATEISYNSGNVVSSSSAFNGGDYVVTYQAGIFGIFATGCDISTIGTSGDDGGYGNDSSSSGFDGDGVAVTGSLYGDSNEVSLGDFVFTNSTLTATEDDLYIKAVDDLWLDALQDDIHIRANDDVRIKVGYDFAADTAQQEWRFDTSGYISFPDGSQQSTAYTGSNFSGDYNDLSNKPTLFDGDYNSLTNKPTIRIAVATGSGPGGNLQADSLALAGLNPTENIPSTYGGDLILQGGVGGANGDLYGEVRIKSGTIGANYEWHFTTDKKIKLPAGGSIVDSTGANVFVSLATLKQVVADSTDFADFQSRIAGM